MTRMKIHSPLPARVVGDNVSIDCACGALGGLYAHLIGAQHAFVQHVAGDAAAAVGQELDRGYSIALVGVE